MTIHTGATAYLYYGAQIYDTDLAKDDEQWILPPIKYRDAIEKSLRDARLSSVSIGVHGSSICPVWFIHVGELFEDHMGLGSPVPVMSLSLPKNSHQIDDALRLLGAPDNVIAASGWYLASYHE